MLVLKNVKKSYDGTPVLKDITLDIEDGEIVSILGPSGVRQDDASEPDSRNCGFRRRKDNF